MYYGNLFIIFSIFGYCSETLIRLFHHYSLKNILFGPWMPIYGIGILAVEFINQLLNQFKIKGKKKILYCYILSVILITLIEEIGGLLVQLIFHTSYWNYESIPLHIGTYINVFISIIWGFFAILSEYVIIPIMNTYIKKIPKWVTILILSLISIDHILSIFSLLSIFNISFPFMRLIKK